MMRTDWTNAIVFLLTIQGFILAGVVWAVARSWQWIGARMADYYEGLEGKGQLQPGSAAPRFVATRLTGATFGTDDLSTAGTLLLFVSPGCPGCEAAVPQVLGHQQLLGDVAPELVLVSSGGPKATRRWLETVDYLESVGGLSAVVTDTTTDQRFHRDFNPLGATPYFCHLGADGQVISRGRVPGPDWEEHAAGIERAGHQRIEVEQRPAEPAPLVAISGSTVTSDISDAPWLK